MVVMPVEVSDAAVEPLFLVRRLAHVEDVVLARMVHVEEALDLQVKENKNEPQIVTRFAHSDQCLPKAN